MLVTKEWSAHDYGSASLGVYNGVAELSLRNLTLKQNIFCVAVQAYNNAFQV